MKQKIHSLRRAAVLAVALTIVLPSLWGSLVKPEKAYRLMIHYQNGKMTLLEKTELNKILPLTVKEGILKSGQQPEGFAFEILDAKGEVFLTSLMRDPTISHMEYPDPQDPKKIVSAFVKHEDIVFSIQVPAPPEARTIRFRRFPAAAAGLKARTVPEELGTFELVER